MADKKNSLAMVVTDDTLRELIGMVDHVITFNQVEIWKTCIL